jgi:hypothetical protein
MSKWSRNIDTVDTTIPVVVVLLVVVVILLLLRSLELGTLEAPEVGLHLGLDALGVRRGGVSRSTRGENSSLSLQPRLEDPSSDSPKESEGGSIFFILSPDSRLEGG